jgi:signal peptidase I
MKITCKSVFKNILFAVKITGTGILLAIVLRVFFLASFKIPSYSMSPALEAGDFILVNKIILWPRVYKSPDFQEGKPVETKRLWGLRKVKHNDILVFNFPYTNDLVHMNFNLNTFYAKRCVAIPGDTFYIEKGIYKVKKLSRYFGQLRSATPFLESKNRRDSSHLFTKFVLFTQRYTFFLFCNPNVTKL